MSGGMLGLEEGLSVETSNVTNVNVSGDIIHCPPLMRGRFARGSGGGTYVMSRTVVVAT